MNTSPTFTLVADGACSGNPGPGGWAFLLISTGAEGARTVLGMAQDGDPATTNNKMELMAAQQGLAAVLDAHAHGHIPSGATVLLHFDSEYVLKGIFEWMAGWKARGWRKSNNKAIENPTHWQAIDGLVSQLAQVGITPVAHWVKGHAGDWLNEQVDMAAANARDDAKPGAVAQCRDTQWLDRLGQASLHIEEGLQQRIRARADQHPSTQPVPAAAPIAPAQSSHQVGEGAEPSVSQIAALEQALIEAGYAPGGIGKVLALHQALLSRRDSLDL